MALTEGLLFADRYKLIRQLGRGGFAEVWLAEDDMTKVQVAVKVYAPGTGLDDNGIKLFTQEFSLVFDMNHTNLLRPTHFDCWDRMPYLIMPLIKNGSAFKYIAEGKSMPEDECWKLLHDVAAGLAYLHEKTPPLIHQDIKSDNILIDDEGRYLITDFGISARVRSTIRGAKAQEQSGGTLAYMGPERFSSNPKPIMASDVWSLGAMMFELMTGLPPFGNHGGMLQKNGADIPIIEGDYSQELKDIVTACIAKETWDRPSASKIEEMTYNKMHGIKNETPVPDSISTSPSPILTPDPVQPATQIKVKNTDQPQVVTPQPTPSIKKSKPIQSGSNKNLIIGVVAAAVVLIGILVAVFSGGGGDEEQAVVEVVPRVNYDSIAQVRIQEALEIKENADTIIQNHPDEYTDASIYNNVEDIYRKALVRLDDALADKDSLDANVTNMAIQQQTAIKTALLNIYKNLDAGAEYVQEFRTRADAIKPLIEDLLENQSNETINEENN
ncbi:MAG: serine/threonine protein kinase [Prevotella sp.]|nr:serine/threonine protein kinase [Prevotella sp.]